MTIQYEPYPAAPLDGGERVTVELGLGPYRDWDTIDIRGVEVQGWHGVYEHEKKASQPFVIDLVLYVRTDLAAASDALDDTIDYVAVSQMATRIVKRKSFSLIEKLADAMAIELLGVAGPHQAVSVTVHKPKAAEAAGARDVSVTIHRHVGTATP